MYDYIYDFAVISNEKPGTMQTGNHLYSWLIGVIDAAITGITYLGSNIFRKENDVIVPKDDNSFFSCSDSFVEKKQPRDDPGILPR